MPTTSRRSKPPRTTSRILETDDMSAANVPMEIDQGEDWSVQIIWTDDFDEPWPVIAPARLDIKNKAGAVQITLQTPDTEVPEGTIPDIGLSTDIGLIQLHIEDTAT